MKGLQVSQGRDCYAFLSRDIIITLAARPALKRFLRVTPADLLRVDKARVKAEENLDGKYLLRCSDPHMTTEDIALGYKQLLEVERGWRDMKQVIDLRPVYHRREDRIRAHVILCWLALLLMRVAENETGQPWNRIRAELQRQHAVTWTGPASRCQRKTWRYGRYTPSGSASPSPPGTIWPQ